MITMNVYAKENIAPVIVEAEAVAGLQKLARIFCGDIEKVTGHQPECSDARFRLRGDGDFLHRTDARYHKNDVDR